MSDIENTFYKSIINNVRQKNINYAMDEFEKSSITIQRKICINVIILKLGIVELETSYLPVWNYCAEVAQRKNEENETAKGTNLKIGKDIKLANFIEKEILEKQNALCLDIFNI